MKTVAFMVASFLSFMPEYLRYIVIGAFAILALFVIIKLVIAVLDALPFV